MLRNLALASVALAFASAPTFALAAEGGDFYILKNSPGGECFVSMGPPSGGEISVGSVYNSHSAALWAKNVNADC